MKKVISLLTVLFVLGVFSVSAQAPKFGHVDYAKVLDSLSSKIEADQILKDFLAEGQETLEEMNRQFEVDYEKYMRTKDSLSPVIREMREKKLMEQQQLLEYKQMSLEQDFEILNNRLYKPIEDNLKKAIKIVGERHKMNYILESNSLLYVNGGIDLTEEVKIELRRLEAERKVAGK